MRRLVWAAFFAGAAVLGVGCFGGGPVLLPTGAECRSFIDGDEAQCEGAVCLALIDNEQDMVGLCSADCNVADECAPHEGCESIPEGSFCFRRCETDDDCYDAFVCRLIALGNPKKYCLIDPI